MGNNEKDGNMYVTFKESGDLLAVPMDDVLWVMEIIQKTPKAVIPNASVHTRGIMDTKAFMRRGKIYSILDIYQLFQKLDIRIKAI